jgi:hypothetical protein
MQFANMLPDSLLLPLPRQDSAGRFRARSTKVVIYHLHTKNMSIRMPPKDEKALFCTKI